MANCGRSTSGINPLVDGVDPLAFPAFLEFDQTTVSFTMTPIVLIPEPGASLLASLGLSALGIYRRRRRR